MGILEKIKISMPYGICTCYVVYNNKYLSTLRKVVVPAHYQESFSCRTAYLKYSFISIQPLGLAGTRTQSGNRYGSGTLHPGQVLRGRLPLLSPGL